MYEVSSGDRLGVWVRGPLGIRPDGSYAYITVDADTVVEMLLRGWEVATLRPADALLNAQLFATEN